MSFYKRVLIEKDPDLQHIRDEASSYLDDIERDHPFRLPVRRYTANAGGKRTQNKWWQFALRKALKETAAPIVQINGGCHFRTAAELERVKGLAESYLNRPGGLLSFTPSVSREEFLASRFQTLMRGKTTTLEAAREKAKLAGRDCPECGYPMKVRTARKGVNAGKRFLGCSLYPTCTGTKALPVPQRTD